MQPKLDAHADTVAIALNRADLWLHVRRERHGRTQMLSGRRRPHETHFETAVRLCADELGIAVIPSRAFSDDDAGADVALVQVDVAHPGALAVLDTTAVRPGSAIAAVEWLPALTTAGAADLPAPAPALAA